MDSQFEEKGCVFLKNVYEVDVIEKINGMIRDFMTQNNVFLHLQKKIDVEEQTFYVNNTYSILNSFHKIHYYYLPVIDNRGCYNRSTDLGMIDIYNANKLFPTLLNMVNIEVLRIILRRLTGIEWKLFRTNIQICNNVTHPSSLHYDEMSQCIKVVIYLSNITEERMGCPCYIEKTHKEKQNIKREQIKKFTGKKGDVLIAYQNGYHSKLPQQHGFTTGFLVLNFIPL